MHKREAVGLTLAVLLLAAAGCTGEAGVHEDPAAQLPRADPEPDEADYTTQTHYNLPVGATVEVCRVSYGLNNRSGPGTKYMVLRVLGRGTLASITRRSGNWARLEISGRVGWSYGKYLCVVSAPSPAPTPGPAPAPAPAPGVFDATRDGIINTAAAFVGFSYWWGGARFPAPWDDPQSKGKGTCTSSTYGGHSGSHGADCSGFVGKVWHLSAALPFDANKHPYSTHSFYHGTNHWSRISRSSARRADALVYRSGGKGHVVIYHKGDPWGSVWTFEARGCAYGVRHNLRTLSSSYRARRRHGV